MNQKKLPSTKVCAPFVVNEKAFCFWDENITEINLRFINQIDSDYFEYAAKLNFGVLQNQDEVDVDERTRQHAAVALRTAYSQGLEVLFSLMFACIQAPHCVIGWFLKYRNEDLTEVVTKFRDYQKIKVYPDFNILEWSDFTDLIFTFLKEEEKKNLDSDFQNFTQLWGWFAQDFLDKNFEVEYNSIKHGLRVYMGGFHLMIGPLQEKLGEITPLDKMRTIAYSKFGSTFFTSEKIEKTSNFLINTFSKNWNPENFYHALMLISSSIKNILVFLKKFNGDTNQFEYLVPNEKDFYLKPWRQGSNEGMGHNSRIRVKTEGLLSKEDILSFYERTNESE